MIYKASNTRVAATMADAASGDGQPTEEILREALRLVDVRKREMEALKSKLQETERHRDLMFRINANLEEELEDLTRRCEQIAEEAGAK